MLVQFYKKAELFFLKKNSIELIISLEKLEQSHRLASEYYLIESSHHLFALLLETRRPQDCRSILS